MTEDNVIATVFRPLCGLPCWNAKPGYGSFLTMEFGQPSLIVREPRGPIPDASPAMARSQVRRLVTVRGEWHLWIHSCAWQVFTGDRRIGHSNLRGSSKRPIHRAADEMDGQRLLRVAVDPRSARTVFEFDLGSRLEARPYDQEVDQWLLYEPSGYVFVLRGDGRYSHQPGDTLPDEQVYQPLVPQSAMEVIA